MRFAARGNPARDLVCQPDSAILNIKKAGAVGSQGVLHGMVSSLAIVRMKAGEERAFVGDSRVWRQTKECPGSCIPAQFPGR